MVNGILEVDMTVDQRSE